MLVYCQVESMCIVKDKTHTHRFDFGPHVHTSTAHYNVSCKVRAKMNIAGVKIMHTAKKMIFYVVMYMYWQLVLRIDHFTVACSVTWPLYGGEAGGDLVLIQTSLLLFCKSSCSHANQAYIHDKSREVCIKARSPPASLPHKGQVTEQTTVKWSIN